MPVASTSVGGAVVALLETASATGRAADLLRYLRGPSGFSPGRVDWLERAIRRDRVDAAPTMALGRGEASDAGERRARDRRGPTRPRRLREAAAESPAALCAAVGGLAATMASRPFRDRRGRPAARPRRRARAARRRRDRRGARGPRRARPAGARAGETRRDRRRARLPRLERAGRGPGADRQPLPPARRAASTTSSSARCRTASSRAATAAATRSSPRRSASASASTPARTPKPRSATSSTSAWRCRAAASSSPTATATRTAPPSRARRCSRRCASCSRPPPPADDGAPSDPVEAAITRVRGLADVVAPLGRSAVASTSWRARSRRTVASAEPEALLAAVGIDGETRGRAELAEAACAAPAAPRPPRALPGRSPTRRCSPRSPRSRPTAAPLWRGSTLLLPLVREPRARAAAARPGPRPARPGRPRSTRCWSASTASAPAATPPPPGVPDAWIERGARRCSPRAGGARSSAATRPSGRWRGGSSGCSSASSAKRRRATPAASSPWLLEARFGATRKPSGRRSTSAAGAPRARSTGSTARPTAAPLVHDYKLSASVTPRDKFEERASSSSALPARRADPLGRGAGRRHLPPAGRDLEHGARAGSSRRARPATSPATTSTGPTSSTDEELEEMLEATRERGGDDRRPHPRRRDPPRPRPARGPARPRRLPDLVLVRADLPPRARALLRGAGRERSREER